MIKVKNIISTSGLKSLGGYGFSQLLTRIQPLIIIPLIVRSISVNEYGIYTLYLTLFGFIIPLITFNTSSLLLKGYHDEIKPKLTRYVSSFVFLSLILLGILFIFFLIFKKSILEFLELDGTLIIFFALINTFLMGIINLGKAKLRSENDLKRFTAVNLISVSLVISLVFLSYITNYLSLKPLLLIHTFSFALIAGYCFLSVLGIGIKDLFQIEKPIINRVLKFCWPLVLHSISAAVFTMTDKLIINKLVDKESLGIYSATFQLAFGVSAVGAIVQMAWSPYLFKNLRKEGPIPNSVKTKGLLLIIGLIIGALIYMLMYPFVFKAYYPDEFLSGLNYFHWFILGSAIQCIYWVLDPFILILEKNIYYFVITTITSAFSISFSLLMVEKGVEYLALSYFLSWLIQLVLIVSIILLLFKRKKTSAHQ